MQNNALLRASRIRRETLSESEYFLSLVSAATENGMMTETEFFDLQVAAVERVAALVRVYTNGESASVRTEVAETLMGSVLYTVGIALKACETPDDAVRLLKTRPFDDVFFDGQKRLKLKMAVVLKIGEFLKTARIPTRAVYYRYTCEKLCRVFYKKYGWQYSAQNEEILPDYPLLVPPVGLVGVEYVQKYFEGLYKETQFLQRFSAEAVERLLKAADPLYVDAPDNIMRPVLLSALGSVLCGRTPASLCGGDDVATLARLFEGKNEKETLSVLRTAAAQMNGALRISSPSLVAYIEDAVSILSPAVSSAVRKQSLGGLFFSAVETEDPDRKAFRFGRRMDDDAYSAVLYEIEQCEDAEERLLIVRKKLHSLYDLEDIMRDYPFTDRDVRALLLPLRPNELAFLLKKHPLPDAADRIGMSDADLRLARVVDEILSEKDGETRALISHIAFLISDDIFDM